LVGSIGAALVVLGWQWDDKAMPAAMLPSPWPGTIPIALAGLLFVWAFRLVRQPLLILTPVGLEVYPFVRPERNMQLILWAEIDSLELDSRRHWLVITLANAADRKVFVSLRPLTRSARVLLERAIEGTSTRLRANRPANDLRD
jgi:hypothetical protein